MASWFKCVFTPQAPFVRTNKFLADRTHRIPRTMVIEMLLGFSLLAACLMLIASRFTFSPILAMIMGLTQFFVLWVDHQARLTFGITHRLQEIASERAAVAETGFSPTPAATPAKELF